MPSSEVLRGEICAGSIAQIVVDIGRVNRLALASLINILEQFVAREIAASLDDPRKPPVAEIDGMPAGRKPDASPNGESV